MTYKNSDNDVLRYIKTDQFDPENPMYVVVCLKGTDIKNFKSECKLNN